MLKKIVDKKGNHNFALDIQVIDIGFIFLCL